MDKANMFWQTYLNLENETLEVAKYIYITDTTTKLDNRSKTVKNIEDERQLLTYSSYIADLLVRCCVEIEAISKEMYYDNGGTKARGSIDLYFDTDCIALLNQKWNLSNKVVMIVASNFNLLKDENLNLTPLNNADKRSKTIWTKAYQAVKHDRYNSLYLGNIKALINAMAALYLLNIYYRDIKLTVKYMDIHNLDMSFGSKIFSLRNPNQEALLEIANGIKRDDELHSTDSPYIAKYTDYYYKQVLEARQQYLEGLNNYLLSQPEWQDPNFLHQLSIAKEKDPSQRVIPLWELCKYRINKKISSNLSFEERRKILIQCEEWNCSIRLRNKHLSENELTPDNIQKEIDDAGIYYAMEIDMKYSYQWIHKIYNEGECEIVLDKGNVKYV